MKATIHYQLKLKRGLKEFATVDIIVDPMALENHYKCETSDDIDWKIMEERCNEEIFDIEKLINARTKLRAHIDIISGIEIGETESMGVGPVIIPPSKEGKERHKKLQKKWKKMEKKLYKKGSK